MVYGPFSKDGKFTSESNAEFDASLRARNTEWGYRYVFCIKCFTQFSV